MKIKTKQTSIIYAGRTLVQPGGYFEGDALSDSFSTTTKNVDLVGSTFTSLESYGNAQATRQYSFLFDFDNLEDAVLYKMSAEEHAAENQTGDLSVHVGSISRTYKAGLTQLDSEISLAVNSIRLILRYSFTTGSPTPVFE